jgi:Tol biopolymer transport system component
MNSDGSAVRQMTPWGVAEHPNWSSNGRWITFDENTPFPDQTHPFRVSHLFRMRSDGSHLEVVFNGTDARGVRNPTFSPDGTKMLFTFHGDIAVLDLKTRDVTRVTKTETVIETNASWGVKQ